MICHFFSSRFQVFSLFLVFSRVAMKFLSMVVFESVLFDIFWISWIYKFMSSPNLGNFNHYFIKYFLPHYFSFSPPDSSILCLSDTFTLFRDPSGSVIFFQSFPPFSSSHWIISSIYFQITDFFSSSPLCNVA